MPFQGMVADTWCSSGSNGALPVYCDTILWAFTWRLVGAGVLLRCLRRVLSFLLMLKVGVSD
jgi:hypothetical protein